MRSIPKSFGFNRLRKILDLLDPQKDPRGEGASHAAPPGKAKRLGLWLLSQPLPIGVRVPDSPISRREKAMKNNGDRIKIREWGNSFAQVHGRIVKADAHRVSILLLSDFHGVNADYLSGETIQVSRSDIG